MGRWKTREVTIGSVGVGGDNPIRIQSMTTSNTRDVNATVDQVKKLADFGCEIVRMTVQGKKEAYALEEIKDRLLKDGYDVPLVADIHFYPPAAMVVADFVEKVRINPGNYLDKRASFKHLEYTDESYQEELDRIDEGFSPLVQKCQERSIAMRIGTNHGSLSDRIMNRFGDTPKGMVESAIEYANVCRKYDYHNFLFSMKASNPLVMQEAYRLLVSEMNRLGWNYPLHLGVTEAGNGEDGRVKSAVGTGALLLDGIGDTIRVSLTEDPWFEIDPCERLVHLAKSYQMAPQVESRRVYFDRVVATPKSPLHRDGTVMLHVSKAEFLSDTFYQDIGARVHLGRPEKKVDTIDAILVDAIDSEMQEKVQRLEGAGIAVLVSGERREDFHFCELKEDKLDFARAFYKKLEDHRPVILLAEYALGIDDLVIQASAELGSLLSDKIGNGICLNAPLVSVAERKSLSFAILQAARMRSSKTEFISCPSCGRTLFDLQKVTAVIQSKTSHLPGVKIAIMGCIVNGPGEMADADFGYVGSRPGMVDLYVGRVAVEKNIPFDEAPDRLIDLIKEKGRWQEPEVAEPLLLGQ